MRIHRPWLSPGLWLHGFLLSSVIGLTFWHGLLTPCRLDAQAAYAKGDVLTALRRALDHLARHPSDPDAARIAGRCLSHLIYADQAETYYEIAQRQGHLSVDDLQVRALGLTRTNRPAQAIVAYEDILRRDPNNPTALQRLAAIHWLRIEIKEALVLASRLSQVPSHAAVGYAMLGEIHHDPNRNPGRLEDSERRPDLAVEAFKRVLELDPQLNSVPYSKTIFWNNFAADLLTLGHTEEARRYLLACVEQFTEPGLLDLLGRSYFLDGNAEEAEHWWRLSVERDPNRVSPWINLGRVALQDHRPQDAVDLVNHAVALDGKQYRAFQLLSSAYKMLGQNDKALRYQNQAEEVRRAQQQTTASPFETGGTSGSTD
jgi:tetratricopeptide (TPR) repeat protein